MEIEDFFSNSSQKLSKLCAVANTVGKKERQWTELLIWAKHLTASDCERRQETKLV